MKCYLNYPFGDCRNCKDITTRAHCIENTNNGYCGCKRKITETDFEAICELCGAIVCNYCGTIDEHGEYYCLDCKSI